MGPGVDRAVGTLKKGKGGIMKYKMDFRRQDYLTHALLFEDGGVDDVEEELSEFNDDAESLAFELAYTRYRVAKLEQFIKNGVELGYIVVPDEPDSARQTIEEILNG
jgi:hypothetical protein